MKKKNASIGIKIQTFFERKKERKKKERKKKERKKN